MEKEDKVKLRKKLPEKEFKIRDSIFSTLFEDRNLKCARNFIRVYFIVFAIQNALNDLFYDGGSQFGFRLIIIAFSKIHLSIIGWAVLFLVHVFVYFGFRLWEKFKDVSKIWNMFWATACFLALFGTFHYVAVFCFSFELPIASRCILLAEQIRYIMKGYAFVRTNLNLSYLQNKSFKPPTILQFVYFSFAPTLIYKNEYPRSSHRSWIKVFKYFCECFICIYVMSLIENEYFMKPLADFGKKPFGTIDVLFLYIKHALPAFVNCVIFAQLSVLHSFQNAFAEMLTFGDREFFTDWWTASSISQFHQKWNGLVQGWLYTYVYKEFYENIFPMRKAIARAAVFTLSIVIHEVLFIYCVQVTLPVFFISMTYSTRQLGTDRNIFTIAYLMIGKSFLYTLPHLEYFAKINCPNSPESIFYVSRLISCKY